MDEEEHVHKVYDDIAQHFSNTRYKGWPVVETFLQTQGKFSVGADIGCGNGKYVERCGDEICPAPFYFGCDRSKNLCSIAKSLHPRANFCFADSVSLPYRSDSFDFAISIAVIHHLNSEERRRKAIEELVRICRPESRILVYVWALEQTKDSKRVFDKQDVLVPWHYRNGPDGEKVYHRYYHVFREGELENLVSSLPNTRIIKSGYDKDNWYVEFCRTFE